MEMKEAYRDKMDARLREWQAKIDALKARADQAGAGQKIKYYEEIESLRTKQQQVHEKLEKLRTAGAGAWDEVKAGVEAAWTDLQDAAQRAMDKSNGTRRLLSSPLPEVVFLLARTWSTSFQNGDTSPACNKGKRLMHIVKETLSIRHCEEQSDEAVSS
jgi:hypothetical protein